MNIDEEKKLYNTATRGSVIKLFLNTIQVWKKLARDKQSSLFCQMDIDEGKKGL